MDLGSWLLRQSACSAAGRGRSHSSETGESHTEVFVREKAGLGTESQGPCVLAPASHPSQPSPALYSDPDFRPMRPPRPFPHSQAAHPSQVWHPFPPTSTSPLQSKPWSGPPLATQFLLPPATLLPFTAPSNTAGQQTLRKGIKACASCFKTYQQFLSAPPWPGP